MTVASVISRFFGEKMKNYYFFWKCWVSGLQHENNIGWPRNDLTTVFVAQRTGIFIFFNFGGFFNSACGPVKISPLNWVVAPCQLWLTMFSLIQSFCAIDRIVAKWPPSVMHDSSDSGHVLNSATTLKHWSSTWDQPDGQAEISKNAQLLCFIHMIK